MLVFFSTEWRDAQGGTVYTVKNPSDCQDFSHIVDQMVMLNGKLVTVSGVDSDALSKPFRKGQQIRLFVKG